MKPSNPSPSAPQSSPAIPTTANSSPASSPKIPAAVMPPVIAHTELTAAQKDTLRRWIAAGAKYESHWSYSPSSGQPSPTSSQTSSQKNPIDAFIQSRLTKEGLNSSPEADRRTLIAASRSISPDSSQTRRSRRLRTDRSPDAYEKTSSTASSPQPNTPNSNPSSGSTPCATPIPPASTAMAPAPSWLYRDYILKSFRDNKPFSDFTREQLAGDLIPSATVDQKIAAAYNASARSSAKVASSPKSITQSTEPTASATSAPSGSAASMGCAECHNHKIRSRPHQRLLLA